MTLPFDSLPRLALFLFQANLVWALGFLVSYPLMKGMTPKTRYAAQLGFLAVLPLSILIALALNHPIARSITQPVTVSIYSGSVLLEALETETANAPVSRLHLTARYGLWGSVALSILGVFFLSARFWTRFTQLFILEGTPHPEIQTRLNEFAQELGLRKPIRVLLARLNVSPFSYGFSKARIIMPSRLLQDLSERDTDLILRHEIHHIRRRDFQTNVLQKLVRIVFFYNPCVHWLDRCIELDREYLCDQAVLATSHCSKRQYAELLVRVAEFVAKYPMLSPQVTFHSKQTHLRKRIQQMKHNGTFQPPPWRTGLTLATLTLSLITISLTGYGENVGKSKLKKAKKEKLTFEIEDDQLTIRRNGEIHRFEADSQEYQTLIQQYERLLSKVEGTATERPIENSSGTPPWTNLEAFPEERLLSPNSERLSKQRLRQPESSRQINQRPRERFSAGNKRRSSVPRVQESLLPKPTQNQFANSQLLPGERPDRSKNRSHPREQLQRERLLIEEMRQELQQHQQEIAQHQQELQEQLARQNEQIQRRIQLNQESDQRLMMKQERLLADVTTQASRANQKALANADRAKKTQMQVLRLKEALASEGIIDPNAEEMEIELSDDQLKVNGEIQNKALLKQAQEILDHGKQTNANRTFKLREHR